MSFDITQALVDFLRRWGELDPSSAAVLALLFVAGGLVPVPRTFMSLAAGVVFGMAAVPVIMPSTTLGSAGVEVPLLLYRDGRTFEVTVKSGDRIRFLKGPSLH